MSYSQKQSLQTLQKLIRLNKNSEAGFRIASIGVKNRGLKALLKSYAQQRAQFAEELHEEAKRLGQESQLSGSMLGGLHRGWILIKAAMTLGAHATETVVLREADRGEQYAVKQYAAALEREDDSQIESIITRQQEAVINTAQLIHDMRGNGNGRIVVRLFDGSDDVDKAVAALRDAGFDKSGIDTRVFNLATTPYPMQKSRQAIRETAVAGGMLGAVLGLLLGIASGAGILFIPNLELAMVTFILIVIAGLATGAGIGAFIGSIIGVGSLEEDEILYQRSLKNGQILMLVRTENERAREASRIMRKVNLARAAG